MTPRNILLVVSLVLSVVIGAVIARGKGGREDHGQGTTARKIRIGLSLDTLQESRWQGDRDRFVARASALGAEVLVQSANGDDAVQIKDCQSLIANAIDVLVVVPHDAKVMAKAVQEAHQQGVPVISYDRLIVDCEPDLYVSFDNVEVGRRQAQFVVDRLRGKGAIVRVLGSPTDNNARLFKQGQDEVLKPYVDRGDISILHEDWAENWSPISAKKIVKAAITKGGVFQAVLASNDGTAGGAIQALSEERLEGIVVTGQDAELAACQNIVGGAQAMTIYKPLHLLANGAAEIAVRMAQHRPVVASTTTNNGTAAIPSIYYPVTTVQKDNLCETVIADGFLSYDDVFRSIPEAQRPPRPAVKAP